MSEELKPCPKCGRTEEVELTMTNKCGNCNWLVTADGEPYYCALRDLYTFRDKQDEACEEFLEADNDRT
jgi:hypothetical protein